MIGIVEGAALGAAFDKLFGAVIESYKAGATYRHALKELESVLSSLEAPIRDIQSLCEYLDNNQEIKRLKEMIDEGQKLVGKCSKIPKWNMVMRVCHNRKLHGFKKSLHNFFQFDMQLQVLRDLKQLYVETKEINLVVKRLNLENSNNGMFSQVPVRELCKVPEPSAKVVGFDVPLVELKTKLLRDGVSVIVVSAPGGSGKTTLVKELCQDEQVKGKFKDNIFYVTVSKAPNLEVIMQKLLQLEDHRMLEYLSQEDALNKLEQRFKQMTSNPILLILDDVWPGFESVVDKLKFKLSDYKILVTSRYYFPRFENYHLKPLDDHDAMTLFRQSAFQQNGNTGISVDVVNKVMKSCKGLPLALEVVGRSLCGQPVAVWKNRARQQSKGLPIFHSNNQLLASLQSSLDSLDDAVGIKDYYLDLGSFPEDHRIPVPALIDMWVEKYKMVDDDDAFLILHELSTRNLVNHMVVRKDEREADGYYNEHFVTQHDLLRELAMYQSSLGPVEKRKRLILELSSKNLPDWWFEEKQHSLSASLLSISTDETFSFSWSNIQAPEVEALLLNFRTKKYSLPVFMEKMIKLKVLIVTNSGFRPAELSNFLLLCSLSNLKRIRLEKLSFPSLSISSLHLKNLQKISLVMCNIGHAFKNSTNKMSDALPKLLEIDIDYCDDLVELTDEVCDLIQLRKLSITNCHKLCALPEGIGKLVNLKVLRLASCTELMTLPDSIGNLAQLNILDISDCLSIVNMPVQLGELHNLEKLYMRGCSSCSLPATMTKLKNLMEVICDEETAYEWGFFERCLPNLKVTVHNEDVNLNWLRISV